MTIRTYGGPISDDVRTSTGLTTIAVASTATVYTKSIPLKWVDKAAVMYKATSSGTINLTIQIEQSYDVPTTEGSSDTKYVIPTSMPDVVTGLSANTWYCVPITPDAMPYMRFKITGLSGNDASTTLQIKLGRTFLL